MGKNYVIGTLLAKANKTYRLSFIYIHIARPRPIKSRGYEYKYRWSNWMSRNDNTVHVQIHKISQSRRHLSPAGFYPKAVINVTETVATATIYTQINGYPRISRDWRFLSAPIPSPPRPLKIRAITWVQAIKAGYEYLMKRTNVNSTYVLTVNALQAIEIPDTNFSNRFPSWQWSFAMTHGRH